jgi:hypothetical protein
VAKFAAGIMLTKAGLDGVVSAVKEGRITFQRILTYTLNSITKKIVTMLLVIVGLIMTDMRNPQLNVPVRHKGSGSRDYRAALARGGPKISVSPINTPMPIHLCRV